MKVVQLGLVLLGLLAVGIKLFTYEYSYADGPTSGVALRAAPGLESRRQIQREADFGGDVILITDENDFPGDGVYRSIVQGGWIILPALAVGVLAAARWRGRR